MPSSSDTDSLSPAQSVAGDLPTPPPSKQQQTPVERSVGAAVPAALDQIAHSDSAESAGVARLRIPSPTAAPEKSGAPSASSALAPAVKRRPSSTPINLGAHKKQREAGHASSSPESESPAQLRAELREAQHEIELLKTQLTLANERKRNQTLERHRELRELNDEIANHKETKAQHFSLSRELEGLKKSRTIDINGARAEEQDAAKVVERELRQRIATLEIADGKRKLGDLARKIEMVEDDEKKLELEEAKVKEARRVKELADDAKARWGWAAAK